MNKRVRESGSSYRKKREKRDKEDAKLKGAMEKILILSQTRFHYPRKIKVNRWKQRHTDQVLMNRN